MIVHKDAVRKYILARWNVLHPGRVDEKKRVSVDWYPYLEARIRHLIDQILRDYTGPSRITLYPPPLGL